MGVRASIWNRMRLSTGNGSQASQAPLGQTRTGWPLIQSLALPVPAEPKMKLESRSWMTASGAGYITRSASFPCTVAMGGRRAELGTESAAPLAGTPGCGTVEGEGREAQAAPATISATPQRYRRGVMGARYTLTETYAKRTLTPSGAVSRFVPPSSTPTGSPEGITRVTLAVAAGRLIGDGLESVGSLLSSG